MECWWASGRGKELGVCGVRRKGMGIVILPGAEDVVCECALAERPHAAAPAGAECGSGGSAERAGGAGEMNGLGDLVVQVLLGEALRFIDEGADVGDSLFCER